MVDPVVHCKLRPTRDMFVAIALLSYAAAVFGDSCSGTPNLLPVITTPPVLVSTSANGKLFQVSASIRTPPVCGRVLHICAG